MAAPAEFFPQQFASAVLGLVQRQKQFDAQLREQRSATAARNFLEKERMDLAERSQRLEEFKAGMNQPRRQEFGQIDAFRQRSAEGAMNVRDQLALMQGQRQIEKQRELEAKVDEAIPGKIMSDFEKFGRAFVPQTHTGLIPGLRASVGDVQGTGLKEEVTRDSKGDIVTTGKVSGTPGAAAAGKVREANAAAGLPQYEVVEVPTKGGTMLFRVGGASLEQQKQMADVKKIYADIEKANAEAAKTNLEIEMGQSLKQWRIMKAEKEAKAAGADRENYGLLRNSLTYQEFAIKSIKTSLEPLQDKYDTITKALQLQTKDGPEKTRLMTELAEVQAQINERQTALETNPAGYLKNINPEFAKMGELIPVATRAAQISASQRASGNIVPPDPDVPWDPEIRDIMVKALPDKLFEMAMKPGSSIRPETIWKQLPTNVTVPFRGPDNQAAPATFFAAADGRGLVPTNKVAAGLADQMEKDLEAQGEPRFPGFARAPNLHPAWRLIGWNPGTGGKGGQSFDNSLSLEPASVKTPEAQLAEQAANTERGKLLDSMEQLAQKIKALKAQGQDVTALQEELKKQASQLNR